jgi:phenylalanyl-tRNA synthetase beta chain
MVIICDDDGPTSIAGIMGGERSEVRPTTTRVLMEAATWNGPNIQRTSHRLGLRSEASGRFEKQLQPEQGMDGQVLAAILMLELTGARLAGGTVDVGGPGPDPVTIRLRDERLERLLGTPIPREQAARLLRALEFGVADADDGLDVTVPAFRRDDVTREADLVEEVARLWGLEKLPATLPSRRGATGVLTPEQRLRRRAEDALAGSGLSEVLGWSFAAPDLVDRLRIPPGDPRHAAVAIRNPMSEDQSVLRTTLLGSLLDVALRNRSRGMHDVRLFEVGAVYFDRPRPGEPRAEQPLPDERQHVAALLTGALRPASWREPEPPLAGFFSIKAVLASLLDTLRVPWRVEADREPFLHPGRSARVLVGDEPAGWLGEIHPGVARAWDLDAAAGFELDLGVIEQAATHVTHYAEVHAFPAVLQDRAWWFAPGVAAGDVLATVREAGGPLLRAAEIFDVYPAEGRVSLAVRLEFRADDRTLTDEEVAQRRAEIDAAVADRLGGEPRG